MSLSRHQRPRRRRRRPLPPTRGRRRTRAVGLAAPRPVSWWLALGALLGSLLLAPSLRAQGLRSATAAVTLVAVRHPDRPEGVRDLAWATGDGALRTVRRVAGPSHPVLLVRDATGRLQSLGAAPVAVDGTRLALRIVRQDAKPPAGRWELAIVVDGPDGPVERRHVIEEPQAPRP